jgi:hypothetical protein
MTLPGSNLGCPVRYCTIPALSLPAIRVAHFCFRSNGNRKEGRKETNNHSHHVQSGRSIMTPLSRYLIESASWKQNMSSGSEVGMWTCYIFPLVDSTVFPPFPAVPQDYWLRPLTNISYVGFEVFTAVVMKSIIFWDMTPCRRLLYNGLHGVISQKMILSRVCGDYI